MEDVIRLSAHAQFQKDVRSKSFFSPPSHLFPVFPLHNHPTHTPSEGVLQYIKKAFGKLILFLGKLILVRKFLL